MPALTQKGCKIVTVLLFYSLFGLCEAFVVVLFSSLLPESTLFIMVVAF